jgi:hypothetical protein
MTAATEKILRQQAYDFTVNVLGESHEEGLKAADEKIANMNRLMKEEENQTWVDITTGKTHKANY